MKPFNLARALAGDPVVTREGKEVIQIVYFDKVYIIRPVVAFISGHNGVCTFHKNGCSVDGQESQFDLFMAPVEKEYWMASGHTGSEYKNYTVCTRLCETQDEIKRLINGTGLIRETIQFHKITRLE